jgi:TPP-dependent pyruvate/acetoin dehydrogenase alpha subunit
MRQTRMSDEELLHIRYYLHLTRALENRLSILYRQGKIAGGVYLSTGQEAVSVGGAAALGMGDVIVPSHRDMGAHLLRGIAPREVIAQFLGRLGGPMRGRDGSVHFGDVARGDIAFISPMGDGIPVAAGVALGLKRKKEGRVCMTWFGEGAASRGDFHEGVNLAAVLTLPVVLICNNNQFAYSTPLERQTRVADIAARAAGYGIPGTIVDGTDVVAVYEAAAEAVARARQGGGPSLIECKTMRIRGHSEHDDASYVPRELLESWRGRDPIHLFDDTQRNWGVLTDATAEAVRLRIAEELETAVAWAEASPLPDPSEVTEGVYSN